MTVAIKCLVSGQVQGVFFRASAREQATSLGLTGYARNLSNGSVEVVACGDQQALSQFRSWLTRGPAGARVTGVACEPHDASNYRGFSVQ
jgi:acylphosphatase